MNLFYFFVNYLRTKKVCLEMKLPKKKLRGTKKFDTFYVGQYGSNFIYFLKLLSMD